MKKKYVKPEMVRVGSVSEITAGGSGSANENNQGQSFNVRP